MAEQLRIDFDTTGHAAKSAAQIARDVAFAALVQVRTVTVEQARARGLYQRGTGDDTVTVWVCPACETWEANEYLVGNNHGIHREYLVQHANGQWAHSGACFGRSWCLALDLTANHATYGQGHLHDRQKFMIARLRPEIRELYEQEVAARTRRHPPKTDKPVAKRGG
ncbi:hypothetical protein [Mycobacteroides abscessus]|uniref:hypothetical protein n=1 Tax=Mycobacteroides abscessus TaxID=36809 RepID=UPI00092AF3CA|nr:hypothetical protein [Mycobacteroides abscessus]SHQ48340.1 Uncharacterised protein [Mycobacteroides abscessus subsp. abscessus]SKQ85478.1 Uncharacterised protein [Mycobacteroides abscessus subsp. massiliense]SLC48991.1 Uncharacterised protein [Mycobacteroides abscessus subsp. massiliense]